MTHRVPLQAISTNMTGKLDPRYEREVERHTAQREAAYRQAEKRLESAQRRAERAEAQRAAARDAVAKRRATREVRIAWERVEMRRTELGELEGLMRQSPAPASSRGTGSYRPVPIRHGVL